MPALKIFQKLLESIKCAIRPFCLESKSKKKAHCKSPINLDPSKNGYEKKKCWPPPGRVLKKNAHLKMCLEIKQKNV